MVEEAHRLVDAFRDWKTRPAEVRLPNVLVYQTLHRRPDVSRTFSALLASTFLHMDRRSPGAMADHDAMTLPVEEGCSVAGRASFHRIQPQRLGAV